MDPVGSSAGTLSLSLAGLGSWSGSKKIKAHIESVYLCDPSYKKMKLPSVFGSIMDLSNSLISISMLHSNSVGLQRSWGSEMNSKKVNISKVSNAKNLENAVAEKTNYMNPNASKTDEMEDNPPKAISFAGMSNDNTELVLPGAKFAGFNWLPPVISCVLKCRTFEPVKLFTLDVKLSNMSGKTNSDKLISIKKIFYRINGFGKASTPSKFSGVIQSTFTSESSLNKAKKMAINKKIIEIIIKEIPVDLPKSVIKTVFSKFGKIKSIKMQLIGLWQKTLVEFKSTKTACLVASKWLVLVGKDSVRMALAINDKKLWISRDRHCALLYTLLVGTTAHDLSELVKTYGGRTCFISCNPNSYVCNKCVIICFKNEASKLAAIGTVPIFKDCKQFGHIIINCLLGGNSGVHGNQVFFEQDWVYLAGIYKKKLAPISRPVFFTGKTWVQVAGGFSSHVFSLDINYRFAALECSLASLTEQVDKLAKKLDALRPMVSQHGFGCQLLMTPSLQNQRVDTVMSEGLGAAAGSRTIVKMVVYDLSVVSKLEDTLVNLSKTVMGFLARLKNAGLGSGTLLFQ
ncbi:hypothetical protein G9A89_022867 [Geosiphon pyriformis]|nr:hypothetical protein G9A89_022867 [Geosiphon pyriformis]